jgi:hypothetical protein
MCLNLFVQDAFTSVTKPFSQCTLYWKCLIQLNGSRGGLYNYALQGTVLYQKAGAELCKAQLG